MFSILQYQMLTKPSNIKNVDRTAFKSEEYAELWKIAIKADNAIFAKCPLRTYDQENEEITRVNTDVCLYAVSINGLLIKYLNDDLMGVVDERIYRTALEQNPLAADYVCKGFMEETETLIAIKKNGYALRYCNDAVKKDPKFLDIALETNGEIIKDFPEYLNKREYVIKALKGKTRKQIKIDKKIYGKYEHDEEIVELIVSIDGLFLDNFEHFNKNKKIVDAALKETPLALQYVDPSLVTREMVLDCIKRHGEAIHYAGKYRLELDLVKIAVQQAGLAMEWLPEYGKTAQMKESREVVLLAVQNEGLALRYSPFFSDDREIAYKAIMHNPIAVRYADKKFYTEPEFLQYALCKYPYIIGFYSSASPKVYVLPHTEDNARLAVKYFGRALEHCPEYANVLDIAKCAVLHSAETDVNVLRFCNTDTLRELAKDYEVVKKICDTKNGLSKCPSFKSENGDSHKQSTTALKYVVKEYVQKYATERELLELIEMNIRVLNYIDPLKLVKNPRLGRWHCATKFKNVKRLETYKNESVNALSTLEIQCNFPFA